MDKLSKCTVPGGSESTLNQENTLWKRKLNQEMVSRVTWTLANFYVETDVCVISFQKPILKNLQISKL